MVTLGIEIKSPLLIVRRWWLDFLDTQTLREHKRWQMRCGEWTSR